MAYYLSLFINLFPSNTNFLMVHCGPRPWAGGVNSVAEPCPCSTYSLVPGEEVEHIMMGVINVAAVRRLTWHMLSPLNSDPI